MNRKTRLIVPVIAGLGIFAGRDWLTPPRAADLYIPQLEERGRNLVFVAAKIDEDSPYIAPYVPTPQEVIDRMLELAEVGNPWRRAPFLLLRIQARRGGATEVRQCRVQENICRTRPGGGARSKCPSNRAAMRPEVQ